MKKADSNNNKKHHNATPASAAPEPVGMSSDAGAEPVVVVELTAQQIDELKTRAARADEHWDRLLRTTADFENFKKRAAREKIESGQSSTAALIQKLLPVLDHFEMAQAAAQSAKDDKLAALQEGVGMIQQQLKSILAGTGVEEIDALGKAFDPALHEAVSQLESAEVPEGHVVQQLRKGYKLRERLLRPASVMVAKKPSPMKNEK
jgi:molecular chaperone GrpE